MPETVETDDIEVFLADLNTHRDRAVVLAMLLGGLRASEVRSLRLADVNMGMRHVTVTGKGSKQRLVPIDRAFFTEVRAYLDTKPGRAPRRWHRVHLDLATHHGILEHPSGRSDPPVHRRRRGTPALSQADHPAGHRPRPGLPLQPIEHVRRNHSSQPIPASSRNRARHTKS